MSRRSKFCDGEFNLEFVKLRTSRNWSQERMSNVLGCSRVYISDIERGAATGSIVFWKEVQKQFNIPSEQMWKLIMGGEND